MFRNVGLRLVVAGIALAMSAGCESSNGEEEDAAAMDAMEMEMEREMSAQEPDGVEVVELPAGTTFVVALDTPLGTDESRSGDSFLAHVDAPILQGGDVVVPAGATVHGTVAEIGEGEETSMTLVFTEIETQDGMQALDVQPIELIAEPDGAGNAVKILGAGAAGAVIGAAIDGGQGAAIGGVAGVTAGTIAVLVQGTEVELPPGQRIALRLDAPAWIPVRG